MVINPHMYWILTAMITLWNQHRFLAQIVHTVNGFKHVNPTPYIYMQTTSIKLNDMKHFNMNICTSNWKYKINNIKLYIGSTIENISNMIYKLKNWHTQRGPTNATCWTVRWCTSRSTIKPLSYVHRQEEVSRQGEKNTMADFAVVL